jgi:hypothetical protein
MSLLTLKGIQNAVTAFESTDITDETVWLMPSDINTEIQLKTEVEQNINEIVERGIVRGLK